MSRRDTDWSGMGDRWARARTPAGRIVQLVAKVLALVCAISVLSAVPASAASHGAKDQGGRSERPRQVHALESDRTGLIAPAGLAFAPEGAFFVVEAGPGNGSPGTEIVRLTPFAASPISDRSGSARIAAALRDPVNVVYDVRWKRLLLLDSADRLLEVKVDARGDLDPKTLVRRDGLRLDLGDPQGMAIDARSGVVYVLDATRPRVLRIQPPADGSLEQASLSEIDLRPSGVTRPRGLALDPDTGHLQLVAGRQLVELSESGETMAFRDLSDLGLQSPQGIVFAPSGDLTDAASEQSLYVADGGTTPGTGQIVELSLAPLATAAAASFSSTLVRTTDMSAPSFSPPSPDPSGIAYLPTNDRLIMCDGEVEETVNGITHFQGANVWEMHRDGSVIRSANISKVGYQGTPSPTPMTDEPTGVAYKPSNGHYFFSEDGGKKVYDLNPGADGLVGTTGDTWTSFPTNGVGNTDPEGVAYDSIHDRLFVADGSNREVYQYTTSGALIGHFDTLQYGVEDPETVEFNSVSGTLFVLSNRQSGPIIIETTTTGALLQTIAISGVFIRKPAGLAYAPASNGSGVMRFYVVDRGVDNNSDPRIIDGSMFELTAPSEVPPTNTPPVVGAGSDQTITLPASATLDGTVSDDGLPDPPGAVTTTWTQESGPGTVTFGDASAVDTTASFSAAGTYSLRLTASDSQLGAFDELTVTVNAASGNQPPSVNAGSDQTIILPASATLDGTVSDDGLPNPPGALTTTWSKLSGPGAVTFGDVNAVDTTASFSAAGGYVLQLEASDGASTASDTVAITVNAPAGPAILYFSVATAQTLGGVPVTPQDVVAFDGSSFRLFVDGSDVGLDASSETIDAFSVLPNGNVLVSTTGNPSVPGLSGKDEDVLELTPTSLGDVTSGTWSMYFDGSVFGLESSGEDVDAVEQLDDGRLLISTAGLVSVPGVSGEDEDALAFTPGLNTWATYFDGTDVGLTNSGEDVDGLAVDSSGKLYLSTVGNFSVTGASGADEDVVVFTPESLGSTTIGTFTSPLFFDGSAFGLAANDLRSVDLP